MFSGKFRVAVKLLEAIGVVVLFTLIVHFLTYKSSGFWGIMCSLAALVIASIFAFGKGLKNIGSRRRMWIILLAGSIGFWVFNLFRYLGYAEWPVGRPENLEHYLRLLYFHLVLSVTVLVPVVISVFVTGASTAVRLGHLKTVQHNSLIKSILILTGAGCWLWPAYVLFLNRPSAGGSALLLGIICVFKGLLTGLMEEVFYRGILQPAAIYEYGVFGGIVFQAVLYGFFHMHLGEAFFGSAGFLAGVFVLGLLFGIVTRLTRGIGWAVAVHAAITGVIEWQNIS